MFDDPVDPESLEGDALTQWYRRSPDEIEQARQKAFAQHYDDFFKRPPTIDPDPGFDRPLPKAGKDIDPGFSRNIDLSKGNPDPGFTWVQVGDNRWRSTPASSANLTPTPEAPYSSPGDNGGAVLDRGLAGPDDGAELIDVGNPANPRLRREWEIKHGRPWPQDPVTGRNHDVAHIVAKADGGTDTLDNIKPLHPDLHRQEHMQNGDFARWAARRARTTASPVAPGAQVVRPPPVGAAGEVAAATRIPPGGAPRLPTGRMPRLPGILGVLGIALDALGIASGRIRARTDTWDNYSSDLLGTPSQQDIREQNERIRQQLCPQEKPGSICV